MSKSSIYGKEDFVRFVLSTIDPISESSEKAREYLEEEGLDAESIASEGARRLRKMRLQSQARQTRKEMIDAGWVKRKAVEWVDRLLADADFSFPDFIAEEQLSLQNRNLESLSEEDMKNTLIQYFTLKFLDAMDQGNDA